MSRQHTDGAACWCAPRLYVPCPQCEPDDYVGAASATLFAMPKAASCWACTNGLRAITREEAALSTECVIAVHW